jgi:hypothetical protein
MAQGVDGSWYAYVADGTFAVKVDALYPELEDGLVQTLEDFVKTILL